MAAAAAREVDEDPAAVARIGLPVHEVVGHHPVDQPREARRRQLRELREVGHAMAVAAGEQGEHAPALDAALVVREDLGEPAGDRGAPTSLRRSTSASPVATSVSVGLGHLCKSTPSVDDIRRQCCAGGPAPWVGRDLRPLVRGLCGAGSRGDQRDRRACSGASCGCRVVDGSQQPQAVADEVGALAAAGLVDAVVGWHISAVRQALAPRIAGLVPYVYTALYEGGERTPGVFLTGEVPSRQLLPAMRWLRHEYGVRRWSIVGNDYVWPRVTARAAHAYAAMCSGQICHETFLPLGCRAWGPTIEAVERSQRRRGADAARGRRRGDLQPGVRGRRDSTAAAAG